MMKNEKIFVLFIAPVSTSKLWQYFSSLQSIQ